MGDVERVKLDVVVLICVRFLDAGGENTPRGRWNLKLRATIRMPLA